MPSVKSTRRPAIDYPSGRGAGLPAAGVHAVDRKLGALPTDFRKQGASGQPSTSADSGYSRSTVQRVNKGFERQKSLEDIPEVSWLKQNAEQLNSMGLTPRLVLEMYRSLNRHTPRSAHERRLIAEMNRRVLTTRREVRGVTRLALLEAARSREIAARLDEIDVVSLVSAGVRGLGPLMTDDGRDKSSPAKESDESEQLDAVLKTSDSDLAGNPVTRKELRDLAQEEDLIAGVLACNSTSLEIFQTFLAVTGVAGDIGTFFGIPVGIASDLLNACINLICGNYFYAMLDLFAVIPFAGDLSKIFYAKRLASTLGLADEMATLQSSASMRQKIEAVSRVFSSAIEDQKIGPKVSRTILGFQRLFGSAERMASRLTGFLTRVIDRSIKFLEGVQQEQRSVSSKAMSWIFGALPTKVLEVLRKIRTEGISSLKEFIVGLFGRKGSQVTASRAQVMHAMEPDEAPEDQGADLSVAAGIEDEPSPYGNLLRGPNAGYITTFDDVNRDGIPDDEQPEMISRLRSGSSISSPYLREGIKGARRKKVAKRPASSMSLSRALSGDDSAVDEMSTVAGSLGAPGEPGAGGYVLPLGRKPTGAKRKSLEQLVPGYEFVGGRYPYSR